IALQSEGNYVRIVVGGEGKHKSKLLRGSLSGMEAQLNQHPSLMRIHRTSIVNTANITELKGDSQGGKVWLRGLSSPLPVSRKHIRVLKQRVSSSLIV
ncbi:MAG: LytTR family DNA-binding domain-containing protein, partial [Calditrichota bacterium]